MKPELFQLKPDSNSQTPVELYYGIELQKVNMIHRGFYFYFMRIPLNDILNSDFKKTIRSDNIQEIDMVVREQIRIELAEDSTPNGKANLSIELH